MAEWESDSGPKKACDHSAMGKAIGWRFEKPRITRIFTDYTDWHGFCGVVFWNHGLHGLARIMWGGFLEPRITRIGTDFFSHEFDEFLANAGDGHYGNDFQLCAL